jgi:hypothetical protein
MINSPIHVIDDFLPTSEFLKLQEFVMSVNFPWFYCEHVSLAPEDNVIVDPLAVETDGFNHIFYDKQYDVKSFTYEYLDNFFKRLEETLGFTQEHMIRIRASLKSPKIGYTEENYNLPHVDYFFSHETMIYYLNDTDGDTRIFDQEFVQTADQFGIGHHDTFTTKHRISPKANRLVWLDGFRYHTASNPINFKRRVILNINLLPR